VEAFVKGAPTLLSVGTLSAESLGEYHSLWKMDLLAITVVVLCQAPSRRYAYKAYLANVMLLLFMGGTCHFFMPSSTGYAVLTPCLFFLLGGTV